eukprot:6193475-Pleurochrysis_carterae.AAC.3
MFRTQGHFDPCSAECTRSASDDWKVKSNVAQMTGLTPTKRRRSSGRPQRSRRSENEHIDQGVYSFTEYSDNKHRGSHLASACSFSP